MTKAPTEINGVPFNDISSEEFRVYEFPNGETVRIEAPAVLAVSASGGHRVLDGAGISHYVPTGWHHLYWKAKDGNPAFVM